MKRFIRALLLTTLFVPAAFAAVIHGNPKGAVTITKYFDYECPHCRTLTPVINQIVDNNKDVKVVSRVIPIMTPESWYVARAVLASREQGMSKFNKFNQSLLAQRQFISVGLVKQLANNANLNMKQLKRDMASKKVTKEIRANILASRKLGVTQIPVMFVARSKNLSDAQRILGDASYYTLEGIVKSFRESLGGS